EDMNNVYKKCDQFEKERLEFFIQQLLKLHTHLNIFDKMNIEQIYTEFMGTIKQTSPDKDLHTWSKECGAGMAMSWPVFEEYSDQVKQIAKSSKKSDEGVTMTSIKQIDDTDTRSLSISANDNNQSLSIMGRVEDPWVDSTLSYTSQPSNELASSFDEYQANSINWSISSIIQKTSADRDDVILTERHKDLVESLNIELKEIRKNRVGEIKSISKSRESSCSSFKSESVYSLNQYKEDKSLKRSVAYETESFSSDSDSKGSNKTLNTQSKKVNFGMTETLERTKASGVIRSMSGKISKHLGTLKQRHLF
ncbi:kinase C and casein kinase substrate in neurons 1-like isoform X1, partial [Brachionus plicatilis]